MFSNWKANDYSTLRYVASFATYAGDLTNSHGFYKF